MDIQYSNGLVVELQDGTAWLEPTTVLETPKGFKRYLAHENESLFFLANRFYQETAMWYKIAKFSGIVDPLDVPVGTILLLPIYDDKNPQDIFV